MAHIKQLCCLGLGAQAIAPPLTRLLLRLVPGFSASIFYVHDNGELANIYDENPVVAEIAPLYVSEFYNKRELEVSCGVAESFRRGLVGLTLGQLIKVDLQTWEKSDLHNLIRRPLGYYSGVQVLVRDRGRPLAAVVISRDAGGPDFAPRELDLLVALEPHLAHALARPPSAALLVESNAEGDQGLAITGRDGRLQYLSPQARVLLFYATHPKIVPGEHRHNEEPALPLPVARLARKLAQTYEGKAPPTPPVHFHENCWGRFVFHAYWLHGLGTEPPLVGIRISRQESLSARLLRRMEHLPLSERQIAVSLHVASGLTYEAIAERLGISRSTVIFHAQEVFNKLGVASRAELQAKLMAL
jgi:DNA-binding CsgD family transcriptional regulator